MAKVYTIKRLRGPKLPRPGVIRQPARPGEVLSGYIGRFKASDIEERMSRAADAKQDGYRFRMQVIPSDPPIIVDDSYGRDQLGAIEVDLSFNFSGLLTFVHIDGEFSHKTAEQKEEDRQKDAKLNEVLRQLGGGVNIRIPGHLLKTQEMTNRVYDLLRSGVTDFGSDS